MQVSVDGFLEGPHDSLDRHLVDDERHRHLNERPAGTPRCGTRSTRPRSAPSSGNPAVTWRWAG
ncbi:MAG TPA: hypothetical protein VGD12_12125, partial [Blastococcus sp.]